MALTVTTPDPQALLEKFTEMVRTESVPDFETWQYDDGAFSLWFGSDYSGDAWMRPSIEPAKLTFAFQPRAGRDASQTVYGVYHGALAAMFVRNFSQHVVKIEITTPPNLH
jgi:hypothetical protein